MMQTSPRHQSSGSTLIIVLIILSLLALIAATLSLTSRLETISSANFAEGIQARMAAATGLETARSLLPVRTPYTANTQSWAFKREGAVRVRLSGGKDLADITIVDESSKLNINAADEALLARSLESILESNNLDPAVSQSLAREIVLYRYGPDGKPGAAGKDDDSDNSLSDPLSDQLDNDRDGIVDNPEEILLHRDHDEVVDEKSEGIDEPDEFIPDPTQKPYGDDTPFLSLEELQILPSMTPEIFEVVKPYLTIFSASDPVCSIEGYTIRKVDANTATAREIYEILLLRYPDRDPSLLKQFAVNIVDDRDGDSIPTMLPADNPDKPFLGIEKTPYINEVWPDSLTDDQDGDDGQYIELYNPYEKPISVEGWTIELPGTSVHLTGSLAPKGFLVVTDDYNNENDPSTEDIEGYGSFYDIFKIVRSGATHRVIEKPELEIPNDSGTVLLKDKSGNLVDYFSYTGGTFTGVKKSFQRKDPRIRIASWDFCSPLKENNRFFGNSANPGSVTPPFKVRDRLYETPADLMEVFSGYTNILDSGSAQKSVKPGQTSSLPLLEPETQSDLDLRLVDLFTVGAPRILDASSIVKILGIVDEDDLYRLLEKQNSKISLYGLLNINTAQAELLEAIPGFSKDLVKEIEQYRNKIEQSALRGQDPQSQIIPFKNISDVLSFIMQIPGDKSGFKGLERDQILNRMREIIPYLTVQSRAFTIYSENRFDFPRQKEQGSRDVRYPARSMVRALLHLKSDGSMRIIDWCYID